MSFQTDYDKCTYGDRLLSCVNKYSGSFSTIITGAPAKCATHYCAIMDNQIEDTSKVMTCSGAVLKSSSDTVYNPLGRPNSVVLDDFGMLSSKTNFETFYFNDIRTAFDHDIVKITCTDSYQTCVTLTDDAEYCFGNIDDITILYPWASFGIGLGIGLVSFGLTAYLLDKYVEKKWVTFLIPSVMVLVPAIVIPVLFIISVWGFFGGVILGTIPFIFLWVVIGKGSVVPLSAGVGYRKTRISDF